MSLAFLPILSRTKVVFANEASKARHTKVTDRCDASGEGAACSTQCLYANAAMRSVYSHFLVAALQPAMFTFVAALCLLACTKNFCFVGFSETEIKCAVMNRTARNPDGIDLDDLEWDEIINELRAAEKRLAKQKLNNGTLSQSVGGKGKDSGKGKSSN